MYVCIEWCMCCALLLQRFSLVRAIKCPLVHVAKTIATSRAKAVHTIFGLWMALTIKMMDAGLNLGPTTLNYRGMIRTGIQSAICTDLLMTKNCNQSKCRLSNTNYQLSNYQQLDNIIQFTLCHEFRLWPDRDQTRFPLICNNQFVSQLTI